MTDVPVLVSAWVAFLFWVAGEFGLASRGRVTVVPHGERWVWLLGAAALSAHVAVAFGRVHGWSHPAAVEATARQLQRQLGFSWGGGVFVNYLLLMGWWGDVAVSWLHPARWNVPGPVRSVRRTVFWFLWFNGAVIFAAGNRRVIAAMLCLGLLVVWRKFRHRPGMA